MIEFKVGLLFNDTDNKGVQLMSDVATGFGGLTEDVLEMVREELPRTPILLYSVYGTQKIGEQHRVGIDKFS